MFLVILGSIFLLKMPYSRFFKSFLNWIFKLSYG